MDVIEKVKNIVKELDELDECNDTITNKLSYFDLKQQDLLHLIEDNERMFNASECYRIIKEVRNVRNERRKVKNARILLIKYNDHRAKLTSSENRKFLLAELSKKEKELGKKYTNKGYTDEEMEKILRGE